MCSPAKQSFTARPFHQLLFEQNLSCPLRWYLGFLRGQLSTFSEGSWTFRESFALSHNLSPSAAGRSSFLPASIRVLFFELPWSGFTKWGTQTKTFKSKKGKDINMTRTCRFSAIHDNQQWDIILEPLLSLTSNHLNSNCSHPTFKACFLAGWSGCLGTNADWLVRSETTSDYHRAFWEKSVNTLFNVCFASKGLVLPFQMAEEVLVEHTLTQPFGLSNVFWRISTVSAMLTHWFQTSARKPRKLKTTSSGVFNHNHHISKLYHHLKTCTKCPQNIREKRKDRNPSSWWFEAFPRISSANFFLISSPEKGLVFKKVGMTWHHPEHWKPVKTLWIPYESPMNPL